MSQITCEGEKTSSPRRPDISIKKKNFFTKYKLFLIIALVIFFLPWIAISISYRMLNAPLIFYSIVLDQDNNPIPGVEVRATIRGWTPLIFLNPFTAIHDKTIFRKTDKNGRFSVKGYYGRNFHFSPYVSNKSERSFQKDGYEYSYSDQPTVFDIIPKKDKNYVKPNPNNPTIFRMRKVEESTFLIQHPDGNVGINYRNISSYFGIDPSKNITIFYDIIKNAQFGPDKIIDNTKGLLMRDLMITGKWDEPNDAWKITFAAGTEEGGIQIQNKKLYMAPTDGYKPEVSFYVKQGKRSWAEGIYLMDLPNEIFEADMTAAYKQEFDKYYFYLKSRDNEIYSRIEMEMPKVDSNRIFINKFNIIVNPYAGERNLETSSPISYNLKTALRKEVQDAFAKDPNAIIPPPPPEMYEIKDSQIPQIMAERQGLISK